MDAETAARRWAEVWSSAWPARDRDAIAQLYSDEASYRALAFRDPDLGLAGVRRYLGENFAAESEIECWFGEPVASGDRAAVEWWGTWVEQGERLTLAGATCSASTTRARSSTTATTGTRSSGGRPRTRAGRRG